MESDPIVIQMDMRESRGTRKNVSLLVGERSYSKNFANGTITGSTSDLEYMYKELNKIIQEVNSGKKIGIISGTATLSGVEYPIEEVVLSKTSSGTIFISAVFNKTHRMSCAISSRFRFNTASGSTTGFSHLSFDARFPGA